MTAEEVLAAIRENPHLLEGIKAGLRDKPPQGSPIKIVGAWEFWPHPSNGGVWSRRVVNGRLGTPLRVSARITLRAFMTWDAGEPSEYGITCQAGRFNSRVQADVAHMGDFITMGNRNLQSLEFAEIVNKAKSQVDEYLLEKGWILQ